VFQHSEYREDPLGRLSRTSSYVTSVAYGSMPEVKLAVRRVRGAHRPVSGTSERGRPYSADQEELAAWVHNALTDSFLTSYRIFGRAPLSEKDADRFVEEQTNVGALLDANPLPGTAATLASWVEAHPDLGGSPGLVGAIEFLKSPPLRPALKAGYKIMFWAASATTPERIRDVLGIRSYPGAITAGRVLIKILRWAMGASPSWKLALMRIDADIPEHLFTQELPIGESGHWKSH
ncbi:MAG TPA: DUF2236 domain-containing protein, partial [Actinobacteria bacterium]|nr:DUF2236 domain-containing protein [Actinomycetota bacterium]